MITYLALRKNIRLANGDRMDLTVTLDTEIRECTTTEHATVRNPLRVSFVGEVAPKGVRFGTNASSYGQVLDHLSSRSPIRQLWQDWHLNVLQAACAHMSGLPTNPDYSARKGYECEAGSGYVYGKSWLTKRLTVDAVVLIVGIMEPELSRNYTVIGRDGFAVEIVTNDKVLRTMHSLCSQSMDWAIAHEGWTVTPVMGPQQWSRKMRAHDGWSTTPIQAVAN